MANTKVQGSYHGFKVQAEINDEGVKIVSLVDSEGAARTKLAGKSFPNARQAGRAAFDAITDYEKLPRLPDARFMTLKASDGKTVSARVATPKAKTKTSKSEPAEVVTKTGVRKSNPAANKSKNAAASAARKPSAVKTTAKDKASPKSVSSSKSKSSTKSAARKVSSGAEDLDI